MTSAHIRGWAAARLILLGLLALAGAGVEPARADGEVCRHGSQSYQPNQTLCLDNVMYSCQDNGAWVSTRTAGCVDPMFTAKTRSCRVATNRTAAHGTSACVAGKRSQCSDGDWIDLGRSC